MRDRDLSTSDRSRRSLRPTPVGWGVLVLVVPIVGVWLIVNARALLVLVLALLLLMVVDAIIAFHALRRLRIDLRPEGEPVSNEPSRWHVSAEGVRRSVALRLVRLPPVEQFLLTRDRPGVITVPPMYRGLIHLLLVDVAATGALGLWRSARRYRIDFDEPIPVVPRPELGTVRRPAPLSTSFGQTERAPRGEDLFRGVRPYVRGDERRRIHWKATARHGELMVREDDGTGIVVLQITVDPGPPGPAADAVIARASRLAQLAAADGWLVDLVTTDQPVEAPRLIGLGRPWVGHPRVAPAAPLAPTTLSRRIRTSAQLRRQLATADHPAPVPPRHGGLRCRVDTHGIRWS